MQAPQLIMLCLIIFGAGVSAARFGELKKPDRYDMTDIIIAPGLTLLLLYWGGFFG